MTTDTIVHALDQLHGLCNATKVHFLRALDELDRIEAWREDGASTLEDWLTFRYAMPWKAASDHVETMRAMGHLPRIAALFEQGQVYWDVFVLLCSFVPAEEDDLWAERAERLNARQIKSWARAVRRRRREEAAVMQGKRYLHTWWDSTGDFLRLNGMIPGSEGALVRKTLDRIADQLGPGPEGEFAPYEERLADALVEIAGDRVANDPDPDRATVVVHVDARELGAIHGKGWVEPGHDLPSEIMRRLSCDPRLEVVVDGEQPVGIGRISRVVPAAMRRQLFARDGGCVVCGRAAGCHAHHIRHWAHGGPTDLDNLVLLCRRCHRLVHDGGFTLARDQSGIAKLVRPDRRPVRSRPMPLRPRVKERLLPTRPVAAMRC